VTTLRWLTSSWLIVQKLKQKQPQSNLQQRKKPAPAGFLLPEIYYFKSRVINFRGVSYVAG